ncbi:MAG: hypothetical protein AAF560_28710 [Acidobacteriota bacterium]
MSSNTSKTVLRELEKTSYLVTSIRATQPLVNARLAELPPLGPSGGETEVAAAIQPPDWDHLQNWAIVSLESAGDEIRGTDHAMRQLRVRVLQLRADRRDEVRAMSSDYRAVRRTFTGVYGVEALALIGLDAEPARGVLAIREQIQELIQRMREPQLRATLPPPRAGQSAPDWDALTHGWQARLRRYDDLTASIDNLAKEAQELRVVLREVRSRNRRLYANVGRVQEGLYRLAGLDDLADRMRAVERSPRKKPESETESEETSPPDAAEGPEGSEASEGEVEESFDSLAEPGEALESSELASELASEQAEAPDQPVQ